jgi:hypothetical protein
MWETYRMLGQDREVELERLAHTRRRAAKPLRPVERRAKGLPLALRLAVTKLKALTG